MENEEKIEENAFDIINHFNNSLHLITEKKEKKSIANLKFLSFVVVKMMKIQVQIYILCNLRSVT